MSYNPLITICFRKGSKRLPDKGIKELCGKQLWKHTLDQAHDWVETKETIPRVIVSTDYDILQGYFQIECKPNDNLLVIKRPPELAKDNPPYKLPAICHAHREMEKIYNQQFNPIIDLDICNPIRTVEDIEGAYQKWQGSWQEVVISVTPARRDPYHNIVEVGKFGGPHLSKSFRQDYIKCYDINCCIYVYSREFLMNNPERPTDVPFEIYEMPIESRFDIDEELDFRCVEMVMGKNREYDIYET